MENDTETGFILRFLRISLNSFQYSFEYYLRCSFQSKEYGPLHQTLFDSILVFRIAIMGG